MKRDMDLIRRILFTLEEHEHGFAPKLEIEGSSEKQIGFHVLLMGEVGLLIVEDATGTAGRSPEALPIRITWNGYEFLEAARDPSIWETAKKNVWEKAGGLTFEILKSVLISLGKEKLGLA